MAKRSLSADEISWILSVDAEGAQKEIQTFSSEIQRLKKENQDFAAAAKETRAAIKEQEKELANLQKQGKQNTAEYASLTKKLADTKDKLTDNTKAVEANRKAIDEQNKKIETVIKTMKVEDMTMSQLKKRAAELQKQLEHTSKSLSPESYAKLERELHAVRGRMDELKESAAELNKETKTLPAYLSSIIGVFVGNLALKVLDFFKKAVSAAKEWVAEGIKIAATAEGVETAFRKLGRPELLKNLRVETKGLLTDFVLMKAAVRAENFQVPIENLGTLLKFAQQRAQETGESVDYLAESIINGIGKKSTMVLDNLGISASRMQDEMKKGGDFAAAAIRIVNEELAAQGDLALTSADKATRASVKWQNAQAEVGKQLLGIRNIFSELSGKVADWFSEMLGKYLPGFVKWLEDIINELVEIYNGSLLVRVAVAAWMTTWKTTGTFIITILKNIGDGIMVVLETAKALLTLDFSAGVSAWKKFGVSTVVNYKDALMTMKDSTIDTVKDINQEMKKVDFTSAMTGGVGTAGSGGRSGGAGSGGGAGGSGGGGSRTRSGRSASGSGNAEKTLKDELQRRLKIIEENLEKETNLLKKQRMESLITEQQYNEKVEELTIESLKKKMEVQGQEQSAYLRYEAQILDMQIKQQEASDRILLQELANLKNEKLKILEATRNAELDSLQESENDQKIYALRSQEIELNTAAARKTILEEYGQALEQAEFKNIQNRQKVIEENSKLIIDAEKAALKVGAAVQKQYTKADADFDRMYKIKSWEQRRADELAMLKRYHDENLLSEEAYLLSVNIVDKKYQDEKLKARHVAQLTTMRETYDAELENITALHEQKMLSEEEYEQAVLRLRLRYISQYTGMASEMLGQLSNAVADLMQAETTNVEARYDAEIAAAAGNAEEVERLEHEKAKKKLDIEKKYADVQFAITAAQIIANTAMGVMQAFAQLGPIAGAIAGAIVSIAGTAQLILANAQRKKVKAMTLAGAGSSEAPPTGKVTMREGFAEGGPNTNFSAGGYTPPGAKYEQAGWLPVHSGEYVVASDEMMRPDVVEKVRAIEHIRRRRTSKNVRGLADGGLNEPDLRDATAAKAERTAIENLTKIVQRLVDGDITVNYGITEMEAQQRRKQDVESIFTAS